MRLISADIDWTNAVVIPLVLQLSLGIFLAIYTGIVASRVFAFFQIRARSVNWLFELAEMLGRGVESPHELSIGLTSKSQPIMTEVRSLGHEKLLFALGTILRAHVEKTNAVAGFPPGGSLLALPTKDEWQKIFWRSQLSMGVTPGNAQEREMRPIIFWVTKLDDFRAYFAGRLGSDAAKLANTKPDYWALFTPRWFPNYVSDGDAFSALFVRRRWWFERPVDRFKCFIDYLTGIGT